MVIDEPCTPLSQALRQQRSHLAGSLKSFPVQRDEHLIMVLRYVLQNPVRAGLSSTAQEWRWSSLRRPQLIDACPVDDEAQLTELIQEDQYHDS